MSQSLMEKLRAVRDKFRASLADRLPEALAALESGTQDGAHQLHRILHELCGTAGMVGEKDVAVALDPALRLAESCAHENRALTEPEQGQIGTCIAQVQAMV